MKDNTQCLDGCCLRRIQIPGILEYDLREGCRLPKQVWKVTCFLYSRQVHCSMHGVNTFFWMTHLPLHTSFYQMIQGMIPYLTQTQINSLLMHVLKIISSERARNLNTFCDRERGQDVTSTMCKLGEVFCCELWTSTHSIHAWKIWTFPTLS